MDEPTARTKQAGSEPGAGARLAIDLGPLVVFFIVNAWKGILLGTAAFMIAITVALIVSLVKYRRVSPLLWFSSVMVIVFGGLTLWLHDETFIKIKPTIYYWTVAALLGFGLATKRNLLKMVLGSAYPGLSERGWQLLSRNFALFFLVLGVVNEFVWRNFPTDVWVGFKLWGALPATIIFGIANMPMLMRHGLQLEDAKKEGVVPPTE
jgi:intracellular septation protein